MAVTINKFVRTCAATLLLTSTLYACGGSGSGGGARLPFPITDYADGSPSRLTIRHASIDDALHSPISWTERLEGGALKGVVILGSDQNVSDWGFVDGVQQTREGIGNLPVVASRSDLDIRYGHLNDGAGSATLSEFIADYSRSAAMNYLPSQDLFNKALRYRSAPVVRFIGAEPGYFEVLSVIAAVQFVNYALPDEAKLTIGEAIPAEGNGSGWPLENTIGIEYVNLDEHGDEGHHTYALNEFRADGSIAWSYIRLGGRTNRLPSLYVIAHELVHALGIYGHVDPFRFRSLMTGFGGNAKLWPTDREALRVLYGRLQPGDDPFSFGPWTSESLHIHGNGAYAGFGVALRNGYAEPWAYGDSPDEQLAENSRLSGSVTWSGSLLGLTPNAEAVAGSAMIRVDIDTMGGRADFKDLEHWSAGEAPGAAGTGSIWGDGDLAYAIAVIANSFREVGGDDGRLTGVFTGRSHQGVAGTLERSDLSAAFGGAR